MEIWKQVKNFEDLYEVSNLGRVRSLDRSYSVTDKRWNKSYQVKSTGRILSPRSNSYAGYSLTKGKAFPMVYATGHQLVANAFIPNPNNLPMIHHINHDKMDNRVENLKWATAKENAEEFQKFAATNGTWKKRAEQKKSNRFSDAQINWMQRFRENGYTYTELGEIFNTGRDYLSGTLKQRNPPPALCRTWIGTKICPQ